MYATQTGFEEAFQFDELLQLCPDGAGGVDSSRLDSAISRASRLADTYLAVRVTVPVAVPSEELVGAVLDLTRYFLYDNQATDEVTSRHKGAVGWLRDIAAGRAVLYTEAEGDTTPSNVPAVSSPDPVFTETVFNKMTHRG